VGSRLSAQRGDEIGGEIGDLCDEADVSLIGPGHQLDAAAADRLPQPAANPATMDAGPDDTTPDGLEDKLKRAWQYLSGNYCL
jgi:hypothetical protein